MDAITIGGEAVLGFEKEDDALLLNVIIRGGPADNPLLKVVRGELVLNTTVTDITLVGPKLAIVPSEKRLAVRLEKHDTGVNIQQGMFVGRTGVVQVFPNKLVGPMGTMIGGASTDCRIGLCV